MVLSLFASIIALQKEAGVRLLPISLPAVDFKSSSRTLVYFDHTVPVQVSQQRIVVGRRSWNS
jgi:hypothetical protein